MLTSKKYMLPVFLFHPYAGAIAVAVCVGHWHFNPGKNAAILDSNRQLRAALKRPDQRVVQYRLQELILAASSGGNTDERQWTSLRAAGIPALDASGHPVRHLVSAGLLGRQGQWTWDGLDDKGQKLPAGIYIVFMELFNLQGKSTACKQAVTLVRKY